MEDGDNSDVSSPAVSSPANVRIPNPPLASIRTILDDLRARRNKAVDLTSIVCHGKSKGAKSKIISSFTKDILFDLVANYTIEEASCCVGLSATILKKICRKFGLKRWMFRAVTAKNPIRTRINECKK